MKSVRPRKATECPDSLVQTALARNEVCEWLQEAKPGDSTMKVLVTARHRLRWVGSGEGVAERNIRRRALKQEIVLTATTACTVGEWMFLLDSLGK